MSRNARVKSKSGIYHIMIRGIDKRDIFLVEDDYKKFLYYIKKAKEKSKMSLLAYCLMTNHVHLLIKEGQEDIGDTIRRITVGYAQYHNNNHGRTGHLFQNRYNSETIKDEKYLLTVIRYIHQNPIKSGIVKSITGYKWSSIKEYGSEMQGIVDKDIPMGYFSNIEEFLKYNSIRNNDQFLDYIPKKKYTDNELRNVINNIIDINRLFQLEVQTRNDIIKRIKEETGASIRQLERVLGIGRNIIQRIS